MLKISELLKKAVAKTAKDILENGQNETIIKGMESYLVSRFDNCPKGHIKLGTKKLEGVTFHIFQKF